MSTAILISDVVKKEVVYSAECINGVCNKPIDENTQLLIEYSIMALEVQTLAPGDIHDVIKYTDGTIQILKGALAIGAFVFPPAAPILLGIAAAGSVIQTLMGWIPDNRPDPVVLKYKELESTIHELEKQMDAHFSDLQNFITKNNFEVEFETKASTLMRFMRNCMKYQNKKDVANFKEVYEQNHPLDLTYSLTDLLRQEKQNPLKMAMTAETAKTKATFEKWEKTINGVIGEFLFIEAFACGLFNDKNMYNSNKIVDDWNKTKALIEEWKEEYKRDQAYWNDVKVYLEDYIPSHTNLNNIQKKDEIKKKLDGYLTGDAFYICVFNATKWDQEYTYHCENEKNQLIGVWNKGRCNAFVYRSRRGAKTSQEAYQELRRKMRDCESGVFTWKGSLKNIIKDQLLSRSLLHGYGFYCLMETGSCDPQISYLNFPEPEYLNKGPGHLAFALMEPNRKEFRFMVSFN